MPVEQSVDILFCQCCRNTLHESTVQLSKCLNDDVEQMHTLEAELSMLQTYSSVTSHQAAWV